MSTANLFQRLRALVPLPPVLVGIVREIHDDHTSTVEIPGSLAVTDIGNGVATGSLIRARGDTVPVGSRAFVRAGVIETQAPDGDPVDLPIGKVVDMTPAPPAEVVYFYDSFTDADGTLLTAHTPDSGGSYSMVFGIEDATLVLLDGGLRRPAFEEDASHSTGAANFDVDASMPSDDVYFEVKAVQRVAAFGELELARNGASFGNGDKFIVIDVQSDGSMTLDSGIAGTAGSGSCALNVEFTVRCEFGAGGLRVYLDGALMCTFSAGADWFAGLLGGTLFDSSGSAALQINSIKVAAL